MVLVIFYSALPVQLGVSSTSLGLGTEKHDNKINPHLKIYIYKHRQTRHRGKYLNSAKMQRYFCHLLVNDKISLTG